MSTKLVTGMVRFSYANVWTPKAIGDSETEKYSVSLLIPKSDKETVKRVKKAIKEAFDDGVAKVFNGKAPKSWKNPLRDGDTERDDEVYEGHYFINANSLNAPQIVDKNVDPILDQSEFYSGCYGKASVNFYAFNVSGNRGIACGLGNLQKIKDGERLGGSSTTASEDFEVIDDDDLL